MKTIAILNEKGGTAKTTTSVNLAASLGKMGKKVLLVDLDGQAASTRWLGVEGDTRLADALLAGTGLKPIENVIPGVSLAPACGKLDSISHNLRPTQGSQLRRVLAELKDRYDYVLIDCPPSLGNRLIGNALLAASHAIVPVETSILALDGLRILLTMLDDIRQGFEHEIELIGALGCRFNSRTRLSRLVLAELHRALPGKVFGTVVHETVRMQECPAAGKSILEYAPECSAAEDYLAVAAELVNGIVPCKVKFAGEDLTASEEVDMTDRQKVVAFRKRAGEIFCKNVHNAEMSDDPDPDPVEPEAEEPQVYQAPDQPETEETVAEMEELEAAPVQPEAPAERPAAIRSVSIELTPDDHTEDEIEIPVERSSPASKSTPSMPDSPTDEESVEPIPASAYNAGRKQQVTKTDPQSGKSASNRDSVMVGVAATVLLGILSIGGWVGFKALTPSPETASARPAPVATLAESVAPQVQPSVIVARPEPVQADNVVATPPDVSKGSNASVAEHRSIVITADNEPEDLKKAPAAAKTTEVKVDPEPEPTQTKTEVSKVKTEAPEPDTAAKEPEKAKEPTTQPAGPRTAGAEDYPSGLTLTAVMYGKTYRRAIISGTVVYEGDKIKDAKVVKILPDSVEIEANGFRFLLGTGPKPVWLKATEVGEPEVESAESASDDDSQE